MHPSIFYSFLLASALTVSAAPLKAVDDITGKSLKTGDVLSDNEAENLATVNTPKSGVAPEDITKIDPVNVVTEVTDAVPVVGNAIPPVDGTTPDPKSIQIIKLPTADGDVIPPIDGTIPDPKSIQIIKLPAADGKVATFKPVDEQKPFSFDFLGAFCCSNGRQILESGGVEKCEISEECLLEIIAFEEEEKKATAILQADKSGAMQLQQVKDLNVGTTPTTPTTPQVNDATVNDILKGVKFDKITAMVKHVPKKEAKRLDDSLVVFVVDIALTTVSFLD